MKTEAFNLATAAAEQTFHNKVRAIRYDSGSGSSTPTIRVRSLSSGVLDVEMLPGKMIKLPELVDGIRITNAAGVAISGKITIGAGDIVDNAIAGAVSINDLQGAYTQGRTSVGSAAAVQLLAADAARRRLMVQNNTTTQYLRVTLDGSAPNSSNGLRLIPGDLLDIDGYCPTGPVQAIFESGAEANVEWAEG